MQELPLFSADFFPRRTVPITGHAGFKGSWLAVWLRELGAKVIGDFPQAPSRPSHFEAVRLEEKLVHVDGDVRDFERLRKAMRKQRPSIVFLEADKVVEEGRHEELLSKQGRYADLVATGRLLPRQS